MSGNSSHSMRMRVLLSAAWMRSSNASARRACQLPSAVGRSMPAILLGSRVDHLAMCALTLGNVLKDC